MATPLKTNQMGIEIFCVLGKAFPLNPFEGFQLGVKSMVIPLKTEQIGIEMFGGGFPFEPL